MPGCVHSYPWALTLAWGAGRLVNLLTSAHLALFLRMCNVQSCQTLRYLLLQRPGYPVVPSHSPCVMWCCCLLFYTIMASTEMVKCLHAQSAKTLAPVSMNNQVLQFRQDRSFAFFWVCSSKGMHCSCSNPYQLWSVD